MIRAYRTTDLGELLDVWHRASVLAHPFLEAPFLEKERVAIATQWIPVAETWVYVARDRVGGFIAMIGNEVGGLFVDPDLLGKGIGRALVDHVRSSRAELWVNVFAGNAIGRRFYQRYGFEPVGEHRHGETGLVELRLRLVSTGGASSG